MEQKHMEWKRFSGLLVCGTRFFLAATLSACYVGGTAPFALGCVAAAGNGAQGLSALGGAALGALLFLEFEEALPFLAIGVLIFTAATAFQGNRSLMSTKAVTATAASLVLVVGGIYVAQSLTPLQEAADCLSAAVLTGAATWYFLPVLRESGEERRADGFLLLAAVLLLGAADVKIMEVSVGRLLLGVLLAYAAYDRGAAYGAAWGLGIGLTADLCMGSNLLAASWGLGCLLAGSQTGQRRTRAALGFLVGAVVPLLSSRALLAQALALESMIITAGFLLLPERLFGGKRIRRAEAGSETGSQLKARLDRAAEALRALYDSMGRNNGLSSEENPAVIFDRAAEQVCRECALCELCWQKEYTGTFNAFNDATPLMLERGRAMSKDFPGHFSSRCIHMAELLAAINGELSTFLLRRQYRRQLEETRRSARGQYAQLSELLTSAAAGIEVHVPASAEERPVCRIGAALRPKDGESVCGDTLMSFQTEAGTWCLLLADGMGSGEAARKESALTCRLLRQFLEAGIEPEAALKTMNAAMALRGAETGSFTTIDLCILEGSELSFYKYGAAPSYLKRRGTVRRVSGGSLPAGLRGAPAAPDVTRLRLEEGSFAVMISDGVADPGRDEWLQDLLAGWEGEDPQALAGLILAESIRRERLHDDCSVQVLCCPEAGTKKV